MKHKILTITLLCTLLCTQLFSTNGTIQATSQKESLNVETIGDIPIYKEIIKRSPERRPGIQMEPQYITVHNTGNRDYGADALMHHYLLYYSTDSTTSWHYTVDNSSIYQHLPLNEVGYHAGDNNGKGNFQSIGIEICENADGNYQQAERNAEKLIAELLYEYNMDISQVVTHNYWSGKDCPHNLLNNDYGSVGWNVFLKNIQKELDILMLQKMQDNTRQSQPLTIAKDSELSLGITYQDKLSDYQVELKDKYALVVESGEVNQRKTYTGKKQEITPDIKATAYVLSNDGLTLPANTFSIETIESDIEIEWQSQELIEKSTSWKAVKEGSAIIYIRKGNATAKLFVSADYVKQPKIVSRQELLMNSNIMDLFTAENVHTIAWESSDSNIVEIKDNAIKGVNQGKAVISTSINGVKIEREIIVK